jgi:uncharacterized protein (DUF362 family)/NAD-dependent dihydropyrimidine dehydrogenase PreA subunit
VSAFARAGEKILLKPNLLAGEVPDRAVTVHPSVFKATAEVFQQKGIRLCYGDSPGIGRPEKVAAKAGIKAAADEMGIPMADFQTGVKISFADALMATEFKIARGVMESDGLVSISKMKTHGLTRITGAVKNQFGCIPGFAKAEYHVKMADIYDFSAVLADITRYLNPRLYIMDGIVAMEGNGPRGGEPRKMKVLLFSTDPLALDAIFCRLIDLNPEFVPFIKVGREAGLGCDRFEDIEIKGDAVEPMIARDFKVSRQPPTRYITSRVLPGFLKDLLSPRPVIDYDRCSRCGQCIRQCPVNPGAVKWDNDHTTNHRQPIYNYRLCIRCYCCQEICPEQAISIKTPWLGNFLYRLK